MTIGSELPIASSGPISILSIVEDDSGRFLDAIKFHRINELCLSWKHVRVLARNVTEIVEINENGIREVALVEVDNVIISSDRAVHNFEIHLLSHLNHLIDLVSVHKNGLIELTRCHCCTSCCHHNKLFIKHFRVILL